MMPCWQAAILVVITTWHEWLSLIAPRVSPALPPPRRLLTIVLALAWGEALALFAMHDGAVLTGLFWVMIAHVAVSAVQWARVPSAGVPTRGAPLGGAWRLTRLVLTLAALAWLVVRLPLDNDGTTLSWFGAALLPAAVRALPGAGAGSLTESALVLALIHGLPSLIATRRGLAPRRRASLLTTAFVLAIAGWLLTAHLHPLPWAARYPLVGEPWEITGDGGFWLVPLWATPFLAHVMLDLMRFNGTLNGTPKGTRAS